MQSKECDNVLLVCLYFRGEIDILAQVCQISDLLLRESAWQYWVR